jgi:Trk-type K+ transport system membrane component
MLTMYVGRLGPLTVATLWVGKKPAAVSRAEEEIPIG